MASTKLRWLTGASISCAPLTMAILSGAIRETAPTAFTLTTDKHMTWRKLARLKAPPEDKKDLDVIRWDGNEGGFYRMGALSEVDEDQDPEKPVGTPFLEA